MAALLFRIVRAGLLAALAAGLAGLAVERARFGGSNEAALQQIESELRHRFDVSADTLGTIAAALGSRPDVLRAASRDQAAARQLFEAADAALPHALAGRTGVTVYSPSATPLAWAGRVSELPRGRIDGPPALFVTPGALGPRLVRVEPVADPNRPAGPRLATVVVEQLLGGTGAVPLADTFTVSTSIVPVSLRVRGADRTPPTAPYQFLIPSRGGGALVEADVSPTDLAAARARWRRGIWAAVLSVLAVTLLLCAGPLVAVRAGTRDVRVFAAGTVALVLTLVAAWGLLRVATAPLVRSPALATPLDVLLAGLLAAALVWVAIDSVERRRLTRPPRLPPGLPALGWTAVLFAAAGVADLAIVVEYERALAALVSHTTLDLLHFSLHPASVPRLAMAFGLVLLHAAVLWSAVAAVRLASTARRRPQTGSILLAAAAAWTAGAGVALAVSGPRRLPIPIEPLLVVLAAVGLSALAAASLVRRERRASQAARLGLMFLGLLVPAAAMYPSLVAFGTAAKERLVATQFGPEARSLRRDLQLRLQRALEQIDALPSLDEFVMAPPQAAAPATDRAFLVWSKTDLATFRLTSAVELYAADGHIVSRFEMNLPEYATPRHQATTCEWDVTDEPAPFGSSERHVLRASRGICVRGRNVGSIVVRLMLDYRTLPFISTESPYLESLRHDEPQPEAAPGRDVEFVVYGWSRAPLFASGTGVWTLPDEVFDRTVASRAPFWATLTRDDQTYRVYFLNDRGGIYALGYPVITWFGHLVNLAELVTLIGVLYLALLLGATAFNALTSRTPASGRALLREIRSSFYRKLFLAFVAAAVLPVVILAVATRAYFAAQFRAGIEQSAARTVTVAQRLVEDYATLQQRGAAALQPIDDQIMVLVGRAIDEDVNLFERDHLQATSARDLFVTGLLPTRTPGDVYLHVVLERLPSYVGPQDGYLLASAPVRAGGREGIVTVPVALQQQQTERQIDELDRRVLFASVLFSLLGAALGYWMAERIADPVNRLTRATRRIARGDLDARIATTSSDELRRLVQDFNQMAADLKRQRAELERTQRLEAWADMARQVAHDIKNPLTPIQLSAEHARRVNNDRGRPLSPALDGCVDAILSQVRLLRQISAEFSSFASQPAPRPEPARLADVVGEVVDPYRAGLPARVEIHTDVPPDLPAVTIDRTLFARALTNVIENALHAMPGGGRIDIDAAGPSPAAPAAVTLHVRDTGVGMEPDAVARIFEPYFSTKASGTGLGLTIAKRNVELNHGTIQVESQRGAGTTVTITLPLDAGSGRP
ncbi:MAG: ATP-binding protein [Betaproteobacteria bacterium]